MIRLTKWRPEITYFLHDTTHHPVLFLEYNGHMAVHLLLLSCLLAKCFSWLEGRVCMATNKQGPSVKDERENSMGLKILFHTRIRWSFASQCVGGCFPFFGGK